MPFLRFSRDKRGYENTFVVHSAKYRGRTRSRVLYWFRTPPSVRVGRAALDEEAIRLIEEHNPDVDFDWTRILKGQDAPEQKPQPEPDRRPNRPQRQREAPPPPSAPKIAPLTKRPDAGTGPDPDSGGAPVSGPDPDSRIAVEEDVPRLAGDEPESAARTRLGAEGLLRLRARHAEVLARISEKISEPQRRDELKSQAERLNPDTWVTAADVTAGLEQYEAVFESLRTVVGRRRKRRKRRSGGETEPSLPGAASPGEVPAESAIEDDDGPDEGEPGSGA